MKNLWEKDRKTIFRELKQMYLEEGYNHKEAKRLAEQETNEIKEADMTFVNSLMPDDEEN
jgi:hypothetical protein|tara:strand:+ start:3563 stop:3742 length:180 start_codon:yes stop_codon:yes gene_type:complete